MLEERVPEELELHVSDPEEPSDAAETEEELILTPSPEEEHETELILTLSPEEEKPETKEELILTPSPVEEDPESEELILEPESIESITEDEEITFDGEDESEGRIRKAMEAYDAAMDAAANLRKKRK